MGLAALNIGVPILAPVAWGYRNPALIGLQVAPIVYVPKSQVRYPIFDASAFTVENLEWEPPAAKHEGESELTYTDATLRSYERSAYVTDKEERNGADVLNLAMRRVAQKVGRIERNFEGLIAGTLFNAANYAPAYTTALAGVTQWSNAASDPPNAIWTACNQVTGTIGCARSDLTVVMGEATWNSFTAHAATLARIGAYQFLAAGFTPTAEMVTPERAAAMLGVARVLVGRGKYRDDNPAATPLMVDYWTDSCAVYYVPLSGGTVPVITATGPTTPYSQEEPSKLYIFRLENHPLVKPPRYDEAKDTTYWDIYDEVICVNASTIAAHLFTNCV